MSKLKEKIIIGEIATAIMVSTVVGFAAVGNLLSFGVNGLHLGAAIISTAALVKATDFVVEKISPNVVKEKSIVFYGEKPTDIKINRQSKIETSLGKTNKSRFNDVSSRMSVLNNQTVIKKQTINNIR